MPNAKLVRAVLPASLAAALACSDPSANAPTAPATRVPDGPHLITNGQPTGSAYGGVGVVLIDQGGDGTVDFLCSGSLILADGPAYRRALHPRARYCLLYLLRSGRPPPAAGLGVHCLRDRICIHRRRHRRDHPARRFHRRHPGLRPSDAWPAGRAQPAGRVGPRPGVVVGYGEGRLQGMQTSGLDGVRKVTTAKIQRLVGGFIVLSGAEGESSHGSLCFGDSGGPMFLGNGDPNTIVGVNEGLQHSGCQGHAVDVRLDTPTALSFLGQYVTP